jgi:hypothetical protein
MRITEGGKKSTRPLATCSKLTAGSTQAHTCVRCASRLSSLVRMRRATRLLLDEDMPLPPTRADAAPEEAPAARQPREEGRDHPPQHLSPPRHLVAACGDPRSPWRRHASDDEAIDLNLRVKRVSRQCSSAGG